MVWAPRCFFSCAAGCSRRMTISGKLLSSRSSTLKRGFSCLIRLISSSSASVSVRVLDDALLQAARLAHVERLAILAEHAVDARRVGQAAHFILDQGGPDQGR